MTINKNKVWSNKSISLLVFLAFNIIIPAQDYSIQTINKEFLTNASAVVRNDETNVIIQSQKKMIITRKRAVTVFNKSQDDFSELYFHFDAEYKIKNLQAIVYDKDGKKIKTIKKSDFLNISPSDGFSLYTDNRALIYKYYPVSYPYTIEYNLEAENSYTVFIDDYVPIFTKDIALENSSYTISNLSGIELRKKSYSSDLFQINEEKTETGWKYSSKNISPILPETLSPSIQNLVPKISFALSKFHLTGKEGSFSNWNDFGKWMYSNLLEPTQQLSEKAKSEIHSLIEGVKDEKEKIRILYQYMQDKTRYVNVSIGIGGWKPMNASEVYAKGYGDCKALTNYMLSILQEVGIPAYYTLINSSESERNFDVDFPKMGGNHAILSIPTKKDTIWLENTSQNLAFNQLGVSTANRNALAISSEGVKIIKTKKYDSQSNTEETNFTVDLYENGDALIKGTRIYKGLQYSSHLRQTDLDSKKLQEIYKENLPYLQIPNFTTCQINNNRNEGIFTVDLDFKVSKYSSILGKDILFNVLPIRTLTSTILTDPNRTLPLEIIFGFTDIQTFNFTIPEGYTLGELSKNIIESSEFGSYTLLLKQEGNKLKVSRSLQIKKGIYPKEKFNDYAKFRSNILKFDTTKTYLTKKI